MKHHVGFVLILIFFGSCLPAFAYLDPGTGSIILQTVVAGIAGSIIAIKIYGRKLIDIFRRKNVVDDEKSEK